MGSGDSWGPGLLCLRWVSRTQQIACGRPPRPHYYRALVAMSYQRHLEVCSVSLVTAPGWEALSRRAPLRSQAWTDAVFVYLRHFHSIFSLSLTACLQWAAAGGHFPSAVSSWITAFARAAQYGIYLGKNYSIFNNLLLSWLHTVCVCVSHQSRWRRVIPSLLLLWIFWWAGKRWMLEEHIFYPFP